MCYKPSGATARMQSRDVAVVMDMLGVLRADFMHQTSRGQIRFATCAKRKQAPRADLARGALFGCLLCQSYYLKSAGAQATPRKASPALAERTVTNLSKPSKPWSIAG